MQKIHRTVTEQVYAQVRDSIHSGELLPSSRIDQAGIARRFGTSLVPVREALARLQADGLVEIIPHRGAFVTDLDHDELVDIYATRELLEQEAAKLAARNLTDAHLQHLSELLSQMEQATQHEDYDALFALNRDFHFTIYAAAQRHHLQQIILQLWDQGDHHRRTYTEVSHRAQLALEEHFAIYQACRRRDPDALGYAMRHHVHQTTVGLLEFLQSPPGKEAARDQPEHPAA
jgi:DNA-binding GntR family transcriptional regulator